MPVFSTLIDDGMIVASDPRTDYRDMGAAVSAVLVSASAIAIEAILDGRGEAVVAFEVVESATGRRERRVLSLDVVDPLGEAGARPDQLSIHDQGRQQARPARDPRRCGSGHEPPSS